MAFFSFFLCAPQEFSRAKQVAIRVRKSDERAVGQQWQAAAGGAPEEVPGGQLQAERVAAGGASIPDAPSVCFSPRRCFPEPRPKPTALLKRPQRLQICREMKECRCYEGNGRRSQPSPQQRCGKWVLRRGGLLTLEAGMFEPLCFVQAANFLIDTQISLSCLFMAESAPFWNNKWMEGLQKMLLCRSHI